MKASYCCHFIRDDELQISYQVQEKDERNKSANVVVHEVYDIRNIGKVPKPDKNKRAENQVSYFNRLQLNHKKNNDVFDMNSFLAPILFKVDSSSVDDALSKGEKVREIYWYGPSYNQEHNQFRWLTGQREDYMSPQIHVIEAKLDEKQKQKEKDKEIQKENTKRKQEENKERSRLKKEKKEKEKAEKEAQEKLLKKITGNKSPKSSQVSFGKTKTQEEDQLSQNSIISGLEDEKQPALIEKHNVERSQILPSEVDRTRSHQSVQLDAMSNTSRTSQQIQIASKKDKTKTEFTSKKKGLKKTEIDHSVRQIQLYGFDISIKYPWLMYTGFSPMCNELIIANLADAQLPQQMIMLPYPLRFACFIEKQAEEEQAQFSMLLSVASDSKNSRYVEYLVSKQRPFEKLPIGLSQNEGNDLGFNIRPLDWKLMDIVLHGPREKLICYMHVDIFKRDLQKKHNKVKTVRVQQYLDRFYLDNAKIQKQKLSCRHKIQRGKASILFWVNQDSQNPEHEELAGIVLHQNSDKNVHLDSYKFNAAISEFNVDQDYASDISKERLVVLDDASEFYILTVQDKAFVPLKSSRSVEDLVIRNLTPTYQDLQTKKEDKERFSKQTVSWKKTSIFSEQSIILKDSDDLKYNQDSLDEPLSISALQLLEKMAPGRQTTQDFSEIAIQSVGVIPFTQRHSMWIQFNDDRKDTKQTVLATFINPEKRCHDIFGDYGQLVNNAVFISDRLLLVNFSTYEGYSYFQDHYWTLIDCDGQIKERIKGSKSLCDRNYQFHESFSLKENLKCLVLQKGRRRQEEKQIVYWTSSGRAKQFDTTERLREIEDEKEFAILTIDDKGQIQDENLFQLLFLKRKIRSFLANSLFRKIAKESIEKMIKTLQFCASVRVDDEGDIYRIATVVDMDKNTENWKEAPIYKKMNVKFERTPLLIGTVEFKYEDRDRQESKNVIKTLIFVCRTKEQQKMFKYAQFVIYDGRLCLWSRVENEHIHIFEFDNETFSQHRMLIDSEKSGRIYPDIMDSNSDEEFINDSSRNESQRQGLLKTDYSQLKRVKELNKAQKRTEASIQKRSQLDENSMEISPKSWLCWQPIPIHSFIVTSCLGLYDYEDNEKNCQSLKLFRFDNRVLKLSLQSETPDHLLQVSTHDKLLLYTLTQSKPVELFLVVKLQEMMQMNSFVDLAVSKLLSKSQPMIWDFIQRNRAGTLMLHTQSVDWGVNNLEKSLKQQTLEHESHVQPLWKTYSAISLHKLEHIYNKLRNKEEISDEELDVELLQSNFDGQTLFSLFDHNKDLLKQIQDGFLATIHNCETEMEEQEFQQVTRKLYRTIVYPNKQFGKQKRDRENQDLEDAIKREEYESTLRRCSRGEESSYTIDAYIELLLHCYEVSISDLVHTQHDMQGQLRLLSQQMENFLKHCMMPHKYHSDLTIAPWPTNYKRKRVTFRRMQQLMSKQKLVNKIKMHFFKEGYRDTQLQNILVQVSMYSVRWITHNRENFLQFSRVLRHCNNPRVYQTDFIQALVDEFWSDSRDKLLVKFFFPAISYMLCAFYFFMNVLPRESFFNEDDSLEDKIYKYSLLSITLALYAYQILVEFLQWLSQDFSEYGLRWENWVNIVHFITTAYLLVVNLADFEYANSDFSYGVLAVAMLTLWVNLLEWCKLFQNTSFYIKLVEMTFKDLRYFILLYLIVLAMFGSALYALELTQRLDQNDSRIIDPLFENFFLNLMYNQWMLALGEFAIDGFDNHPSMEMAYALFLLATLCTSIVFLNMLIAIMSNTFDCVMEKREQYAQQTKLNIMSDYAEVFNPRYKRDMDKDIHMFIVRPLQVEGADEEEEAEAWEGSLSYIKKHIQTRLSIVEKSLTDQHSKTRESQKRESAEQYQATVRELKSQGQLVNTVNRQVQSIDAKIDGLEQQLLDKIKTLVTTKKDQVKQDEEKTTKEKDEKSAPKDSQGNPASTKDPNRSPSRKKDDPSNPQKTKDGHDKNQEDAKSKEKDKTREEKKQTENGASPKDNGQPQSKEKSKVSDPEGNASDRSALIKPPPGRQKSFKEDKLVPKVRQGPQKDNFMATGQPGQEMRNAKKKGEIDEMDQTTKTKTQHNIVTQGNSQASAGRPTSARNNSISNQMTNPGASQRSAQRGINGLNQDLKQR